MEFTPINADRTTYYTVTRPNSSAIVKKESFSSLPKQEVVEKNDNKKINTNYGLAALGTIAAVCAGIGIYKHAQCKGLNRKLSEIIPENSELKSKIGKTEQEIKKVLCDNQELSGKLEKAKEEVIQIMSDNQNLTNRLNSAQVEVLNGTVKNDKLTAELTDANNKIQQLQSRTFKARFKKILGKLKFWK